MEDINTKKEDLTDESQARVEKARKRLRFWQLFNFLLLLVALLLVFLIYKVVSGNTETKHNPENKGQEILNSAEEDVDTAKARRFLDGVYVPEGRENPFPVAIIFDNHLDAQPQSSLSKASIVYEAEVEGGATRYLGIFVLDESMSEIGPIRSARSYFVDWVNEYSALFVHVGGSPGGLAQIIRDKVADLNEFYNGSYFWRDSSRYAPHNVYTSANNLNDYMSGRDLKEGMILSWEFKDDSPLEKRPESHTIKIDYGLKENKVTWAYDRDANVYHRQLTYGDHKDRSGERVTAKNVIIQEVIAEIVDEKLRLDMRTTGEGKAALCLDGSCQEAVWKKKNTKARTRFYNMNEEEIKLNAGKTWVQVVTSDIPVTF